MTEDEGDGRGRDMDASMVTGIVKENWNEELPGRIKAEYRLGEEGECLSGWMPVMAGYCGPGYGSFLLPEVGAEVVVGFLHGNRDCPFVMGCLQGLSNALPEGAAAEGNEIRLMRTKGGWQLKLDEKERTLCLSDDKEENKMFLAAKDGCLTLDMKDRLELKIEGEPFLTVEKGTITLAPDVVINGQKIDLKAEKGLTVSGESVNVTPDKGVTVKGGEIELSPSGTVTVKGESMEISPQRETVISGAGVTLKPSQTLELKAAITKVEGTSLELKSNAGVKMEAGGIMEIKGTVVKLN